MEEDSILASMREEVEELQDELAGVKKELRQEKPLDRQLLEVKGECDKAEGRVEACETRLADAHKAQEAAANKILHEAELLEQLRGTLQKCSDAVDAIEEKKRQDGDDDGDGEDDSDGDGETDLEEQFTSWLRHNGPPSDKNKVPAHLEDVYHGRLLRGPEPRAARRDKAAPVEATATAQAPDAAARAAGIGPTPMLQARAKASGPAAPPAGLVAVATQGADALAAATSAAAAAAAGGGDVDIVLEDEEAKDEGEGAPAKHRPKTAAA